MAITLDSILNTAQSAQSRKPQCRIYSVENVPAIPFNGEFLTTSSINEQHPAILVHSTGRLVVAYMQGPGSGSAYVIRYGYTDTARTYFTYVDISLGTSHVGEEVSICEMADTYIGLVWEETYGGTRYIKYRKITVDGADLSPAVTGTIFSQTSSLFFTGPTVATMSDGTYLLVYGAMDGSDYKLYRRTSSDFVTWSAASEIPVAVLTSTMRKANPSLLVFSTGTVWLLFDYVESIGPNAEELTNIYYMSSDDNFATPSNPAALTAYTEYSEKAEHPAAALNSAGLCYLVYDRLVSALSMEATSTGWCGSYAHPSNMHLDVTNQKLYVISSWMSSGNKTLGCVVKIDLATWAIDNCWSTSTEPAFPTYFSSTGNVWWDSNQGGGQYVAVGHSGGVVSVLDGEADTITNYVFYDRSAYGLAQNVTWTPPSMSLVTEMTLAKTWVDADNARLYVLLTRSYAHQSVYIVGYLDLTAAGPSYTFTTVLTSTGSGHTEEAAVMALTYPAASDGGWMEINVDVGLVILYMPVNLLTWKGKLRVYDLASGGLLKDYNVDSNPTFPYHGLKRGVYSDGYIVGTFDYESLYGQVDYRGICIIDITTDVITYNRPSWAFVDDYGLQDICLTNEGEFIIAAYGYGITLFDGAIWTLYDNASLPGMTSSGEEYFAGPVVYNPSTRMIIAGHSDVTTLFQGLIMFSRDGYIRQSTYRIGTPNGSWSWNTAAPLVGGYTDYEASVYFDPTDNYLYAFWTNMYGTELSIKWDKEMPSFDLTSYLVRGETVERYSSVDTTEGGWDAGLNFSVKDGHLFDVSNTSSLLRQYLAKGRRIQQQFGDRVGGVDYWETARIFTVSDDGELDYSRGSYPVMAVRCETPRRRWEQIHIRASEYYETTPELIIADLLTTFAGISAANISLGTWDNSATIEYQFVDVYLAEAVNQIAYHFGYVIRDGANGIIQAVKITDEGTVTRTYSDNTKMTKISPKNTYSNFVNRWIVQCEERTFVELLMQEEMAAELIATHGWYTGEKTYRVYYTQGDKIYRNPRLAVVQSITSIAFQLAGSCSEELLDSSHDESDQTLWDTYCEVVLSSPDLTPLLISALAALVAAFWLPDIAPPSGGPTYPIGKYVALAAIWLALNILASMANFQCVIYAQPVVKVRRTVQATANDTEAQTRMGQIIPDQPFDDPLCGSASDCQTVADFRKMVGMSERNRWSAEMIADLANEEGDTISVIHPYSAAAQSVFITDLKTTYTVPVDKGTAGIIQEFEGWRI